MATLYITDMDGTVLDNEARLPADTARIFSELTARGVCVSVATARTPATVEPLLEGVATARELVVMTGSAIWDRSLQRFVDIRLIPASEVPSMLRVFASRGLDPFCYVLADDDRFLDVYHPSPTLADAERLFVSDRARLTLKSFHLGEACPPDRYGRVALFFGMGSREAIVGAAEELRGMSSCYISYYKDTYSPDLWLIEIFAPGVSKASGVKMLKERLCADRVVAFGDNLNDIPMLLAADLGVAVANALPEVKEIADVVIGPNTGPSVARFIAADAGIDL